ncbi:MAG: helix-turn-helix domain-containing protein [Elusimicrobia bacterium]|nr:helix-turn-helix domain-containing protein [Elusimicrobiota bacterium]
MLERRGHVNSVNFFLESVWGNESETYNDPRTVQVHMSRT